MRNLVPGGTPLNRKSSVDGLSLFVKSKPQNSQIVSVKGVAAMKFSSGEESKSRANPFPIVNRHDSPLQLRGIILPQGRLSLPRTPPTTKGITSAE